MNDAITNTGLCAVNSKHAAELAREKKLSIRGTRAAHILRQAALAVESYRNWWWRRLWRLPVKTDADILKEWGQEDAASFFSKSPIFYSSFLAGRQEKLCDEVLRLSEASVDLVVYLSPCQLEAIHHEGWAVSE